jgi:prepilin-type N-terminal cleavage/methylation domain-containing protein
MKKFDCKGFTLIELLATVTIMAVLITAALPYVSSYAIWAQATSQERDAQTVASAISRWVAAGGHTTGTMTNYHDWTNPQPRVSDLADTAADWKANVIIQDLMYGWTVVPNAPGYSSYRDPFIQPNTAWTVLAQHIRIGFTNQRNWTVTGRTLNGMY